LTPSLVKIASREISASGDRTGNPQNWHHFVFVCHSTNNHFHFVEPQLLVERVDLYSTSKVRKIHQGVLVPTLGDTEILEHLFPLAQAPSLNTTPRSEIALAPTESFPTQYETNNRRISAMEQRQRIDSFLGDDGAWTPGIPSSPSSPVFSDPQEYNQNHPPSTIHPSRTLSSSSTASRSSKYSADDVFSPRAGSISSSVSSADERPGTPPWHVRTHEDLTQIQYNYILPCEFAGCQIDFPPDEYELWIRHTMAHFDPARPPTKAVCLFCDFPEGRPTFEDAVNPIANWRARLLHIGRHYYQDNVQLADARPDYFVTQHMAMNERLGYEQIEYEMNRSERPMCDDLNIVDSNFQTPLMIAREAERRREQEKQIRVQHTYNIRREERERRGGSREKENGRENSHRSRRV
jgi:hypothetical protein